MHTKPNMVRHNMGPSAFVYVAFLITLLFLLPQWAVAEILHKPFIMASQGPAADIQAVVGDTKQKLTSAGFEIAGEYSPYPAATILIITNASMKNNAAASKFGGFGAAQRVTLTKVDNEVQIAFTNPVYWSNAYRMKSNLADVATKLKSVLGVKGEYGPDEGLSAEDIREYHYKWLMPYFDDRIELVTYESYEQAIKEVEASLGKSNKGGVKKTYRIDIPNKKQSVIGVNMTGPSDVDCSGDKYIMERIDFKKLRSTGHLPYELLISGNTVYTLPAEFRIAISFPDLSMMGSNSFASIMCAPNAITEALTLGAGGSISDDSD